jgi:putative transposase
MFDGPGHPEDRPRSSATRYRRDKISAISAITVSPRRHRLGLCVHLHSDENISHVEVAIFLRALLRHLQGHVIVLLDGGSIHKGPDVQALCGRHAQLHLEWFHGYAPGLNPDEFMWAHFKGTLANGSPKNLDVLLATLCRLTRKVRASAPIFSPHSSRVRSCLLFFDPDVYQLCTCQ